MKKILADPLVHFLVLGLGLFVLFDLVASDEVAYDSRVINVDRDALLTFVQYRLRAFQPQAAAARLAEVKTWRNTQHHATFIVKYVAVGELGHLLIEM